MTYAKPRYQSHTTEMAIFQGSSDRKFSLNATEDVIAHYILQLVV